MLRSEWTKFWSLRSTRWTLLAAVVLTVGLGALISAVRASHHLNAQDLANFNPTSVSLSGMTFAAAGHRRPRHPGHHRRIRTGMIRSSLTVVPKRLPVLWSKIAVTASTAFGVMLAASMGAFFIGQALLSSHGLGTTIGAPGALRSVVGAALTVSVVSVIGVGLGAVLRNTAAAISTFVGVFFVLPPLLELLPSSISTNLSPYMPSNAASALFGGDSTGSSTLSPWAGFAVLCGYAVAIVAAAAWRLRKTDA